MKSILHFLNQSDFESFTSQLLGEDRPNFMAIEGAGGDGGVDGVDGDTVFQMYFPETKNRNKQHYIKKIDTDILKARATADKLNFEAKNWILVVPEDLSTEVTLHLVAKAKEHGFSGMYWGATKEAFPGVFLPELKSNVERIDQGVGEIKQQLLAQAGEIMTETEFASRIQLLKQQQQFELRNLQSRVGDSSAQQTVHQAVNLKFQPLFLDLQAKKAASDRLYELEKRELEAEHEVNRNKINADHQSRGVYHSGMRIKALHDADVSHNTKAEKLALKYGKEFTPYPEEELPPGN